MANPYLLFAQQLLASMLLLGGDLANGWHKYLASHSDDIPAQREAGRPGASLG